jgi:hypothetical protein
MHILMSLIKLPFVLLRVIAVLALLLLIATGLLAADLVH